MITRFQRMIEESASQMARSTRYLSPEAVMNTVAQEAIDGFTDESGRNAYEDALAWKRLSWEMRETVIAQIEVAYSRAMIRLYAHIARLNP